MRCFFRWIKSLALTSTILSLLRGVILYAEVDDSRSEEVSGWGRQIRQALETDSLKSLEVNGLAVKKNPSRHVEVRQYHLKPTEIQSILKPAATVLENREFKIADEHNLPSLRVSFKVDLPSICPTESTQFVIDSTAKYYFYVGCVPRDPKNREAKDLVRIWSPNLDKALRKFFPLELYPNSPGAARGR